MKAARIYGPRDLRVEQAADPSPGPGEALIRIRACGVCPSDVRGYTGLRPHHGKLPWTPGHEWAGVVEDVEGPADGSVGRGDRVVVDWRRVCGRCYQCRRGVFNYCEALATGTPGGFADYGLAPLSQLRVVPGNVSFEEAAFCEPLACVVNAHSQSQVSLGSDITVIGAGPIGLLHLQVALRRGGRVIVSDPLPARRQKALELGAHQVVDASEDDPVTAVRDLTDGRGADMVVVAVGGAEPARQGLAMAAIGGEVNLFAGTYPPAEVLFDPNLVHYRQLRVTGSHDYTPHHFTAALRLIAFGIVRVAPLISHRFSLDKIERAFETSSGRSGLKAMVLPDGATSSGEPAP